MLVHVEQVLSDPFTGALLLHYLAGGTTNENLRGLKRCILESLFSFILLNELGHSILHFTVNLDLIDNEVRLCVFKDFPLQVAVEDSLPHALRHSHRLLTARQLDVAVANEHCVLEVLLKVVNFSLAVQFFDDTIILIVVVNLIAETVPGLTVFLLFGSNRSHGVS